MNDFLLIENLLSAANSLPLPEPPEPTIFSIGGRGYYENPTTDLLAFYCDPEGPHQLGDRVLRALFECLAGGSAPASYSLQSSPAREVITNYGRVDLLLEGNDWVLVVENKIFHDQINPFDDYVKYVTDNFKGKIQYYIVLSPQGTAPPGWQGISYPSLLVNLKSALAEVFYDLPVNKWMVLLREFVLNLEQIMDTSKKVPEATVEFFLEHLSDIGSVVTRKDEAMRSFQIDLHKWLQEQIPNDVVQYKWDSWHGYPALRFFFDGMYEKSSVALFLDGRKDKGFRLNWYIQDIQNDVQRAQADNFMSAEGNNKPEDEDRKRIRCYSKPVPGGNIDRMKSMLKEALEKIREFEKVIRPNW